MFPSPEKPQLMTSQELEAEIRKHRQYVKSLIAEAKLRRAESRKQTSEVSPVEQKPV